MKNDLQDEMGDQNVNKTKYVFRMKEKTMRGKGVKQTKSEQGSEKKEEVSVGKWKREA